MGKQSGGCIGRVLRMGMMRNPDPRDGEEPTQDHTKNPQNQPSLCSTRRVGFYGIKNVPSHIDRVPVLANVWHTFFAMKLVLPTPVNNVVPRQSNIF